MTRFGVLLPTFDTAGRGVFPLVEAATRAEALGFDSAWVGDHLVARVPVLDPLCALSAAAAVTRRIELGVSVLLLGLRQPVWAAKQLTTIDALAPGRLRIGVGVGGEYPQEFAAAGVDPARRGALLDDALRRLPDLLTGETIAPRLAERPRVYVGGRSDAALRRAARVGGSWLGMWKDPADVARATARLRELGVDRPQIGMLVLVNVDDDPQRARAGAAALLERQYAMPLRVVERWTAMGPAAEVAAFLRRYEDVGVREFVLMPAAVDPVGQYRRLAEVRDRMRAAGTPDVAALAAE